jgi:hypothetical protein
MNTLARPGGILLPLSARGSQPTANRRVLAVGGGTLDEAVIDLALVLARDGAGGLDLLVLAEVPFIFPLRAYSDWLMAHGAEAKLDALEQRCEMIPGESGILLCRSTGAALEAEVRARGSTDLVVGVQAGSWWRRRRTQRMLTDLQARTSCRVYVVQMRLPPDVQELPTRVVR